jgi:hypothetical protein
MFKRMSLRIDFADKRETRTTLAAKIFIQSVMDII